jgi:hypothetical protein
VQKQLSACSRLNAHPSALGAGSACRPDSHLRDLERITEKTDKEDIIR